MITLESITAYFNNSDNCFDLRKNNHIRWMDQKCTPDVLWSISDFVLDYLTNVGESFTPKDIWKSEYAKQTIAETYSKPDTSYLSARNEYNKVIK